tara:strand:- start:702 stop:893 length:192 start_codon:yes stop_codon:yes gene_type:complete
MDNGTTVAAQSEAAGKNNQNVWMGFRGLVVIVRSPAGGGRLAQGHLATLKPLWCSTKSEIKKA